MSQKNSINPKVTVFIFICFISQMIYGVNILKTVLYDPFRELLNISNTEVGVIFSAFGLVGMLAYIPSAWLIDRYQERKIIGLCLSYVGITTFLLLLNPSLETLLFIFMSWGFTQSGPFFCAVLKVIRCIHSENKQSRGFSFFETLRGITELMLSFIAILVFSQSINNIFGMKVYIFMCGVINIIAGIVALYVIPDINKMHPHNDDSNNSFVKIKEALRLKETWLVAASLLGIYTIHVCFQWLFPYIRSILSIPESKTAIVMLVATSLIRIISAPLGGLAAEKIFKKSYVFIKYCISIVIFILCINILLTTHDNYKTALHLLIIMPFFVYALRSIYFAPVGELGIPKEISGATISIIAFIGYSPVFWLNYICGYLIDNFSKQTAFLFMLLIMLIGAIVTLLSVFMMSLMKRQNKYQSQMKSAY